MGIHAADVADIIATTLATFQRFKWSEIATTEEEHYFLPSILRKERVRFQDGYKIVFDVMTDDNGGARNVGLFQQDSFEIKDVMKQGDIPWRHTTNAYAFDRREFSMNKSPSKIVDLVQTRRAATFLSLSNLIETNGWGKPPSSSDADTPFGIKYYITKKITGSSAATSTGEFGGGNPSGFSAGAANIDSVAFPTWANWTQAYVDVSKSDLVKKMRTAKYRTGFKSPIKGRFQDLARGPDRYQIYCPYSVRQGLEDVGEQQNENLGKDIASMDDQTVFRRIPINAVPKLDDDTDNPLYFINWNSMYIAFLVGEYLNESPPEPVAGMHTTIGVNIDLTWNLMCTNRRRFSVLSTAADND